MFVNKILIFLKKAKTAILISRNKSLFYILILLNIPSAIFIILISSIYKIRIGELEIRAIGHCSISIEIFLGELELNLHKKNSKHIWFINDSNNFFERKISNHFLLEKWKEKILIGPRFIFEPLFYIFRFLRKFSIGNHFLIPYRHWLDHSNEKPWQIVDIHNVLGKTSPQIRFSDKEEEIGKNYLEKYGLEKEKYICFFARTSEFRQDESKSIRDSDIRTQIYGIEKLCNENNLKAVRLGYSPKTKLDIKNKNIIDYSNSQDRSDFLDFYLGFNCKFIVGTSSGGCFIPMMNRKKLLCIDLGNPGQVSHWTASMVPLVLLKRFKLKKTNEYLTFKESFNLKMHYEEFWFSKRNLDIYSWEDNSYSQIYDSLIEMLCYVNNSIILNFDPILQNKFNKIFEKYTKYSFNSYISPSFLKKNLNLLD
jgi:putative glycosyltransferase (TIGR04372 family)